MTLGELLALARCGAALDDIRFAEFENIEDFAKTWRNLADVELEDLDLTIRPAL